MNKLIALLAASLLAALAPRQARAQVYTPTYTPRVNMPVPGGPGMPMMMFGRGASGQKGICVLTDSSRVSGKIFFQSEEEGDVRLRVKTDDGQKQEYMPTQMAYLLVGQKRYIPVTGTAPDDYPSFAEVQAWGRLQAVHYAGSNGSDVLLLRPRGSLTWVAVPAQSNLKKMRAAVGPLVADQPDYAAALADGRITHDNLLQFVRSYNNFVAKQP